MRCVDADLGQVRLVDLRHRRKFGDFANGRVVDHRVESRNARRREQRLRLVEIERIRLVLVASYAGEYVGHGKFIGGPPVRPARCR